MFDAASTWIEHWPAEVQALSFRQRGLALSGEQMRALHQRNRASGACTPAADDAALGALAQELGALLQDFPRGAFVRLGSRSPKDTPLGLASGCHAASGTQAVKLLASGSRRLAHDLSAALAHDQPAWVWLREWHDIPWADEWRCFVRTGQLVGVCQYHAAVVLPAGHAGRARAALPALRARAVRLAEALSLPAFVFDVWLRDGGTAPLLIEINPWGPATEAGLFEGIERIDCGLRWRTASGLVVSEPSDR